MKPAVDEMFPEGAGPYVDLDEVGRLIWSEKYQKYPPEVAGERAGSGASES